MYLLKKKVKEYERPQFYFFWKRHKQQNFYIFDTFLWEKSIEKNVEIKVWSFWCWHFWISVYAFFMDMHKSYFISLWRRKTASPCDYYSMPWENIVVKNITWSLGCFLLCVFQHSCSQKQHKERTKVQTFIFCYSY